MQASRGLVRPFSTCLLRHVTVSAAASSRIPAVFRTMASDAERDITAPPADKQVIVHDGKRYTTVKEGLAYILLPESAEEAARQPKDSDEVQNVFYNPIQQFNRDLTVLAIRAYGKERLREKLAMRQDKRSRFPDKKRKRHDANAGDSRPAKTQKVASHGEEAADPPRGDQLEQQQQHEPATGGGTDATAAASSAVGGAAAPAAAADAAEPTTTETTVDGPAEGDFSSQKVQAPHQPRFTILDALSATGLRALRYAHEIPFVTSVTSNDLLATATETIRLNVRHNGLQGRVHVSHDDAVAHMYTLAAQELRRKDARGRPKGRSDKYDVIDLDPYGSAAPFLDAAVQAVRDDGGLLCVTCTDSGVWASNGYPEKAYALYGGIPMKGGMQSHEGGLRLILHAVATSAARYGLAVEPLLSLSVDYYARLFVRLRRSPASVKFQAGKTMVVYNCDSGCGAWATQLLARNKAAANKRGTGRYYKHVFAQAPAADRACEHCGSVMHLSGPMYAGRLHSPAFVRAVLAEVDEAPRDVYGTVDRMRGMLQTALEEFLPSPEEAARGLEQQQQQQQQRQPSPAENKGEEAEAAESISAAPPPSAGEQKRSDGAGPAAPATDDQGTTTRDDELAAIDPYPFFFIPTQLAGKLHCRTPPEDPLRGALLRLGYRVTRSHCKPGSIRTDAPWSVIWHVMREWVRQKAPVKVENIKPGTPAYRLLRLDKKQEGAPTDEATAATGADGPSEEGATKAPGDVEVVFDEKLGRDPTKGLYVRYQANPRENWGPMTRAKGH